MTTMTRETTGRGLLVACLGMFLGLVAMDFNVPTWGELLTPTFVGRLLFHAASVISAYYAGQVLPTQPRIHQRFPPR